MDISKIMDLFGRGDDKPEELEVAMEKQILPESPLKDPDRKRQSEAKGASSSPTELTPPDEIPLPEPVRLVEVGRCPNCGDTIMDRADQPCAWCNATCRPEQDGFHLVHVALGTFQERHCFCSDECFEAFRRMYPPRVHRNCYERPCSECHFCVKRYTDEFDGFPGQEQDTRPSTAAKPEKA